MSHSTADPQTVESHLQKSRALIAKAIGGRKLSSPRPMAIATGEDDRAHRQMAQELSADWIKAHGLPNHYVPIYDERGKFFDYEVTPREQAPEATDPEAQ